MLANTVADFYGELSTFMKKVYDHDTGYNTRKLLCLNRVYY